MHSSEVLKFEFVRGIFSRVSATRTNECFAVKMFASYINMKVRNLTHLNSSKCLSVNKATSLQVVAKFL